MTRVVRFSDDPSGVLEMAGGFLASDPVAHNLILSLLHARVAYPEPGRYWIVESGSRVAGVVLQSPTTFLATTTPMAAESVTAAVDAIVAEGVVLPGVNGEAGTAASFAGQWTERTGSAARPVQGQRIYELDTPIAARPVRGAARRADQGDLELVITWLEAFQAEMLEQPSQAVAVAKRRVAAGQLWLWDDAEPVALAGISAPVAGVARVGPVYTPPDLRGRGYASAVVATVSAAAHGSGQRCILYTDLANPTSNSIYRAVGYRAVAEALRYSFATE